ncbi:uncharacterized protein LOC141573049 [Rhinolophus sinicus]|uniref:uncharacterized protein LOC141573049 n=1 Tax=Rhinolophus sinicus TaxID=89399 RepID=UPI003D7A795C
MQIQEGGEFPKEPTPGGCATWAPSATARGIAPPGSLWRGSVVGEVVKVERGWVGKRLAKSWGAERKQEKKPGGRRIWSQPAPILPGKRRQKERTETPVCKGCEIRWTAVLQVPSVGESLFTSICTPASTATSLVGRRVLGPLQVKTMGRPKCYVGSHDYSDHPDDDSSARMQLYFADKAEAIGVVPQTTTSITPYSQTYQPSRTSFIPLHLTQ